MREDFTEFKLPREVVERHPPDREGLFALLCREVTDEELLAIARSDYENDVKENFEVLQRIRDGEDVGDALHWVPNEVLCLYRWNTEDKALAKTGSFHRAHAFACAALLHLPDTSENRSLYSNDTLVRLIESSLALGEPYSGMLTAKVVSMLEEMQPWDEDYLFAGFGLLALLVLRNRSQGGDPGERVALWLEGIQDEALKWHSCRMYSDIRSFLHLPHVSISADRWKGLAGKLRDVVGDSPPYPDLFARLDLPKPMEHKVSDAKIGAWSLWMVICQLPNLWRSLRGKG